MPQLRLMGLALVITTIFLALAAAATQTTHIRIKRPSRASADPNQIQPDQFQTPGVTDGLGAQEGGVGDPIADDLTNGILPSPKPGSSPNPQFVMVPIAIPLAIAGIVGAIFWFGPAPRNASPASRRRRRRGRR